ncbi:MAG: poly-gamma-glutamate hydrolase family protein [Roseiarcus sp.]|jgi:phage replication-related protein YjqB (UPF0714/DUF867 family)
MTDRYASFEALAAGERGGREYRIRAIRTQAPVAIVAPHGGEIEPGTSEIAEAIADGQLSLYCFEGLVPGRPHGDLHIRSEKFDEPIGIALVEASETVVGVHGRKDADDRETVWLGGLDDGLRDAIAVALERVGFKTKTTGHALPGRDPMNICNRGRRKAGAQLELPRTLRNELVANASRLQAFAGATRSAIDHHQAVRR